MPGHLRRRGDAWELRAFAGRDPISRREKYTTQTFHGGKREAEAALVKLVTEVSRGGFALGDTTVGDLIGRWFDLARTDLSPTTVRGYERVISQYLLPRIGE